MKASVPPGTAVSPGGVGCRPGPVVPRQQGALALSCQPGSPPDQLSACEPPQTASPATTQGEEGSDGGGERGGETGEEREEGERRGGRGGGKEEGGERRGG